MKKLWVESYRPKTTEEYVFCDDKQRSQVAEWISSRTIPHLLFSGSPGVGKTALARVLVNELEINEFDFLEINASRENSVDTIRDKIISFVETMPFGDFKVVLLDEADFISPNGQAALRGVMETYHSTARFILTCNYPHKIIPALHSRCQGFHINKIDMVDFLYKVATVLISENVEFELDTIDTYAKATYPDLRKCLNMCQMNSVDGKLLEPAGNEGSSEEYLASVVKLFKEGQILEARKKLCENARPDEMDQLFRWMYENLDIWSEDKEKQDQAILIIRNGLVNHALVSDPEINLSATLCELVSL